MQRQRLQQPVVHCKHAPVQRYHLLRPNRIPASGYSAAATASIPATADPRRVLFAGGLPADIGSDVLQQQLHAACAAAGLTPTKVQVMAFESDSQRSRFSAGWMVVPSCQPLSTPPLATTKQLLLLLGVRMLQHRGYALLAFRDEAAVEAAAVAVRLHTPSWGAGATLGPARKVPADWAADLTYTPEEQSALQQQAAALAARRAHNRRQRQRQSQRVIDAVSQLLSSLQEPFGPAALQLYQPLLGLQAHQHLAAAAAAAAAAQPDNRDGQHCGPLQQPLQQQHMLPAMTPLPPTPAAAAATAGLVCSSLPPRLHHCMRWPVLQQLLQQQQQQQQQARTIGPIELAAAPHANEVEGQLLLDWSRMPSAVDPAFGGRLADADVVRLGRGRLNLRALRKRVQVESFALLLWQLTSNSTDRLQQHSSLNSNSSTSAPQAAGGSSGSGSSSSSIGTVCRVVELGSGSGNLVLPLAHLFPALHFIAVDMKPSALRLLQQRVDDAGLTNVTAQLGRIEEYAGPADVVLALHACGSATDWALSQAAARRAAFIVSPCCIGKINRHSSSSSSSSINCSQDNSGNQDPFHTLQHQQELQQQQRQQGHSALRFPGANAGLQYPRSKALRQQMTSIAQHVCIELGQQQQQQQQQGARSPSVVLNKLQEAVLSSSSGNSSSSSFAVEQSRSLFSILAATADYSHTDEHSHPDLAGVAKSNVELDRGAGMREAGYAVALLRLLQPQLTAKSDVLVGVHAGTPGSHFCWQQCL